MGMTIAEKIMASHSGKSSVKPGDIITCAVDYAGIHDMMFFLSGKQGDFSRIIKVFDPERIPVFIDHGAPSPTVSDAESAIKERLFVKKHGIKHFFDIGRHGVIHQKLAEAGFALPGKLIACSDSHTCAAGAFNCAARGFGPMDMMYILCTGQNWYRVAGTVKYELYGTLPDRVTAKDVFLYIAGVYGESTGFNVEFGGPGVANLSIASRQSITTMCAEINAEFAIFPSDDVLTAYLRGRAQDSYTPVIPDEDAVYAETRRIHLSEMTPYISGSHYVPHNCRPVRDVVGMPIHQALLGSCSNGRIEDIALAAGMIKGKKTADNVRFIVTPASQDIYVEAIKKGYFEILAEAGAVITNATCGACYGGHMGLLGAGERCISTTTRNFQGRMGSPESEVLLAGPATVVASAVSGKITDPRDF
jgi:3-isopropylmalate/(R)-2-methylmalate dehydratase large subunit